MRMSKNDLDWAVRRLPKDLKYRLEQNVGTLIIAGGYLRSIIGKEFVNDIDVFTSTKEDATLLADTLTDRNRQFITDNAISFNVQGINVQIITKWNFQDAEGILQHFDFTVVQAAIWYNKTQTVWEGMVGKDFYQDLAAKRLSYTYPHMAGAEPGASLLRVLKYRDKGYTMPLPDLAEIISRLAGVDNETVTEKLKEIDPRAFPEAKLHKYSSEEEINEPSNKIKDSILVVGEDVDDGYGFGV